MNNKIWSQIKATGNNHGVNLLLLSGITLGSLLLNPQSSYAAPFNLTQTFNNPTPTVDDLFGSAVSVSGNNVLIGEIRNDSAIITNSGAVHLFDAVTGNLQQTFLDPTPAVGNYFGISVSSSGNNVLIGASGNLDSTGLGNRGAAYLFDGVTGNLLQTFLNPTLPTPGISDGFGYSVSISGNNVLIGAPGDDLGFENSGAAYLFDGVTGNLLQTFLKSILGTNEFFGSSVSISGNNVLISARHNNTGGDGNGSAYLFDGVTGNLLHTFLNPTPTSEEDLFGYSVSISGNNVLIGAAWDDAGATDSGAAYLFDGATGNLVHTFLNPTPEDNQWFGWSVSVSGNNVLIGSRLDSTGATYSGAAYLFDAVTGNLLQTILNPTSSVGAQFGYSVSASSDSILIGAFAENAPATNTGAAYLYRSETTPPPANVPEPSNIFGLGLLGLGLAATKMKGVLSKKTKTPTDDHQEPDPP